MALFGKKKNPEPADSTPAPVDENLFGDAETGKSSPKPSEDVFDFDAIAKDLEANGGASPFDALLSAPASPGHFDDGGIVPPTAGATAAASGSAFDFPDVSAPSSGTPKPSGGLDDLDALFGAPGATPPPVSTRPVTLDKSPVVTATPSAALPIESDSPPTKKKLPLLPMLGALGVLALAGGAGYFLTQGGEQETEPTSIAAVQTDQDTPPDEGQSAISTTPTNVAAVAPAATSAPVTGARVPPGQNVAPVQPPTQTTGSRPAPPTAGARPAPADNSPAPASVAPAQATSDVAPELLAQLKNLWEQGKAAKQRGDYAAARRFWTQALALKPGHPGFQESINKLPQGGAAPVVSTPTDTP